MMDDVLTKEIVREIFDYDPSGHLIWKEDRGTNKVKGKRAGHKRGNRGYLTIEINDRKFQLHRVVFLWHHGYVPDVLDHINRNPNDNRIENLREASFSQNSANATKRKNASSKWKGVSFQTAKGKWRAYLSVGGVSQYLGSFFTEEDAAQVYNFAAFEAYGEFAVLNEAVQDIVPLLDCR